MCIKQLYNDNLRKLPNEYRDVSVMLINLIEWTFKREGSPYIACNERQAFSLLKTQNDINFGPVKTCVKP